MVLLESYASDLISSTYQCGNILVIMGSWSLKVELKWTKQLYMLLWSLW